MLGLVLFNIFINDRAECTLSVFTDDTKLGGEIGRPDSCAAIRKDVDKLEK